MRIDILKVDEDTITVTGGYGKQIVETMAVTYTADVEVGGCSIRGEFNFSDEFIVLDNDVATQRIRHLFNRF